MIGTKAIVAVVLTGLGGITTGTAAYLQAHPRAFTHVEMGQKAEPVLQAAPAPPAKPSVRVEEHSDALRLEPVLITSRVRHRAAPVATAHEPESASAPCSEWKDLATGPAGRRVRLLCQP